MSHEDRLMFLLRILEGTDPPDLRFILEETLRLLLDREVDRAAEEERRTGRVSGESPAEDDGCDARFEQVAADLEKSVTESRELIAARDELRSKVQELEGALSIHVRHTKILAKVVGVLRGLGPEPNDVVALATQVVHDRDEAEWHFRQLEATHAATRTEVERLRLENDALRKTTAPDGDATSVDPTASQDENWKPF